VAYGREANFVYPPRPGDPKVAWNQQWQMKVRYRSATGGMLGMTMPGMDGGDDEDNPRRRGPRGPSNSSLSPRPTPRPSAAAPS
jgi:hypothetical protein